MTRRRVVIAVVVVVIAVIAGIHLIPSHENTNPLKGWSYRHIDTHSGDLTLTSVSCASKTFCVAVDGSDEYTFTGASWSRGRKIDPKKGLNELTSVSCASSAFAWL